MTSEQDKHPISISERIKSAHGHLGVSKAEIQQEMTLLFQKNNSTEMKNIFSAYLDWEMRNSHNTPQNRTAEEIKDLAKRNFDYVASVADSFKITKGDLPSAIVMSTKSGIEIIGPVRQFFRDSIGYNPDPAKSQLN